MLSSWDVPGSGDLKPGTDAWLCSRREDSFCAGLGLQIVGGELPRVIICWKEPQERTRFDAAERLRGRLLVAADGGNLAVRLSLWSVRCCEEELPGGRPGVLGPAAVWGVLTVDIGDCACGAPFPGTLGMVIEGEWLRAGVLEPRCWSSVKSCCSWGSRSLEGA